VNNIIGRPVDGDDFFGREQESLRIWELINEGNDVILLGPRRVGKTSLLRYLKVTAAKNGFIPVEISLADVTEEIEFVRRLYSEIAKHPKGKKVVKSLKSGPIGKFFKRTRKFGVGWATLELDESAAESWSELGEKLTEALGTLQS